MNIYQIRQITYLGNGRRHEEVWYIQANRAPTTDEIRRKLYIPTMNTILIIQLAHFDTWDLP